MINPNRRIDDPKPPAPAADPQMQLVRQVVAEHFPLLQSLDWTSVGTAMRDFDKRLGAAGKAGAP